MFERLTNRTEGGIAYTKIPANPSNMIDVGECYTGRVVDRIAAYEDSGLSPDEVVEIKKYLNMWIEICKENNVSIVQFKKWAEAEQDGRLVVLPVKVGDTIYRIISYKCNAVCNKLNACNSFIYKACKQAEFYVCPGTFQLNDMWWIGKTVFLTREEAEKALLSDS
jgi:hypothetical protein